MEWGRTGHSKDQGLDREKSYWDVMGHQGKQGQPFPSGGRLQGPDGTPGCRIFFKFIGSKRSGSLVLKVLKTSKIYRFETRLSWKGWSQEPTGSPLRP